LFLGFRFFVPDANKEDFLLHPPSASDDRCRFGGNGHGERCQVKGTMYATYRVLRTLNTLRYHEGKMLNNGLGSKIIVAIQTHCESNRHVKSEQWACSKPALIIQLRKVAVSLFLVATYGGQTGRNRDGENKGREHGP
jgi:hypothetical protein